MKHGPSSTPSAERPHIAIVGRRNVGKSCLINALAQQSVALDSDAVAVVTKERELHWTLENLRARPKPVATDSQAIMKVQADVPRDVQLTTFSILFARYRGGLRVLVHGLRAVERLKPGEPVLVAEACTHHPLPDGIGRVKILRWLMNHIGGRLEISVASGCDFPEDLQQYKFAVHCGECMITRKTMNFRTGQIVEKQIPVVNYGVLISYLHGAVPHVLESFPSALFAWEKGGAV